MKRNILKGVLVDFCIKCRSFWLDKDELQKLRDLEMDSKEELKKQAMKEKKNESVIPVAHVCPRCFGSINSFKEGTVLLEKCSRCEGMFFDRGELDACLSETPSNLMKKIMNLLNFGD